VNTVNFWIRNFPALQQQAIREAIEGASLAKARRALGLIEELPDEQRGPPFEIELLATFNLEPVLHTLEFGFACLPSQAELRLAPLNDIEGYISANSVPGNAEAAKARVILWRVEELLPEVLFPFSHGFPGQLSLIVDELIERVRRVIALHHRSAPGMPLLLSTIALPLDFANRVFAAQNSAAAYAAIGRVNQELYTLATTHNGLYIIDLCAWAAAEGKQSGDTLLDLMARQPFSSRGQMSLGLFLARSLRPLIYPRFKVLAVDLDNTLWGGVVGEDGVNGLKLGQEFPGNVHLRIQHELLELRNRGVLLVLLSKNNEADARVAFESLPDMLLKLGDFTVRKIDWNDKHKNLRAASRELGLGVDSFALIDDSDYEREQMRQFIPEVRILNDSGDPLAILRALWETDAFDSLTVTVEDRARHHDYAVRSAREVSGHEDDLEAFLQSLKMEAAIEQVGPENIERVVNMLGKTNQFNLTTRRHSRAQVESLVRKDKSISLALRLRDKFGEQGIVAVLLAVPGTDKGVLIVDSFLVSCRALGRGVEDAIWAEMLNRAQRQGVQILEATYIPTAKNAIVASLYDRLGLQRITKTPEAVIYRLEPVSAKKWPSWIVSRNGADER
jgi:FkbH-like protein